MSTRASASAVFSMPVDEVRFFVFALTSLLFAESVEPR